MKVTTIGIDLANNVFQVHGVDERGKATLKRQFKRAQVAEFFAILPSSVIGMEACCGAHHWARNLQSFGHTVRLMSPQFVKPSVKTNKNDAVDAEAICEAVARPSMRYVPIKNVEQEVVLALHRARQDFVKARTSQANQIRGLLAEFGLVVSQVCVTNAGVSLRCCTEDGKGPPEAGLQGQASNRPVLLRPKYVVVSDRGNAIRVRVAAMIAKLSESEPADDASFVLQGTVETAADQVLRDKPGRHLLTGPAVGKGESSVRS